MDKNIEYCKCEKSSSVYTELVEWGRVDKCSDCDKVIEDSFKYDNELEDADLER